MSMQTIDAGVTMSQITVDEKLKQHLSKFLKKNKKADLITTFLSFLEKKHGMAPVLFIREKTIYKSKEEVLAKLEAEGKLWRETEVKIQVGQPSVNEETKKIYICPYTGKVFGDNTHPNPQDAIYDWVSTCPENTDRIGGLRAKRFFVSDDPEMIKNYIQKRKDPVTKTVYSSGITGKLFNKKQAVIDDFIKSQLKSVPLADVPNQNRFTIEESLLHFIEQHLEENRISSFVEAVSEIPEFAPHVERWIEEFNEE